LAGYYPLVCATGLSQGASCILFPRWRVCDSVLLLGIGGTLMIGKVLFEEFFNNRDWPVQAAVFAADPALVILIVPLSLFQRNQTSGRGGVMRRAEPGSKYLRPLTLGCVSLSSRMVCWSSQFSTAQNLHRWAGFSTNGIGEVLLHERSFLRNACMVTLNGAGCVLRRSDRVGDEMRPISGAGGAFCRAHAVSDITPACSCQR